MVKTKDSDLAYTCECDCVEWVMRKDNRLECSECQSVLENVAWVVTPVKMTAKWEDGDGIEKTKSGELVADGVERETEI